MAFSFLLIEFGACYSVERVLINVSLIPAVTSAKGKNT